MATYAGVSMTILESPVPAAVTTLIRLLEQVERLIMLLDDGRYAEPPSNRPSGSIGAHVRHCLDHVTAFLDGAASGVISYDRRVRNTAVESNRAAALERIAGVTAALVDFDPAVLDRPLRVDVQLEAGGLTCSTISTAGRELAFVISHTIHHNATMGVLLSEWGLALPQRFGYAPATPSPAAA